MVSALALLYVIMHLNLQYHALRMPLILEICINVFLKCAVHCNGVGATPPPPKIKYYKIYPTFVMYILFIERQRRIVADMLDHITGAAEFIRDSFAVYEH